MATNLARKGDVITFANTAGGATDIVSNDVVSTGSLVGVALVNIPVGTAGALQIEGVFTLAKDTAIALTQGQAVFWDTADKKIVDAAGTDVVPAGVATIAAPEAAPTVEVKLNLFTPDHAVVTGP